MLLPTILKEERQQKRGTEDIFRRPVSKGTQLDFINLHRKNLMHDLRVYLTIILRQKGHHYLVDGICTKGGTRTLTWGKPDWILSPARLPLPPLWLFVTQYNKLRSARQEYFTFLLDFFSKPCQQMNVSESLTVDYDVRSRDIYFNLFSSKGNPSSELVGNSSTKRNNRLELSSLRTPYGSSTRRVVDYGRRLTKRRHAASSV